MEHRDETAPEGGDFAKGDVHIQGKRIVAVGRDLKAPAGAQIIDAAGTVVIPGFVDCHRHSWSAQFRRIIPDGLIANYMIKPVDKKWHMSAEEVAKLQAASAKTAAETPSGSFGIGKGGLDAPALLFWAFVGVPLLWGVWITLKSAVRIF